MQKRIGIIRGGGGDDHESSIREGSQLILHVMENLSDRFKPIDVFIDKDGIWHISGVPADPKELYKKVDVVWNTSRPEFSHVVSNHMIPHVSLPAFATTLSKSRQMLEEHLSMVGVDMPRSVLLPAYKEDIDGDRDEYIGRKAQEVWKKFPAPWTVRSFTENKNMAIHLAKTFPELMRAIEDGVNQGNSILVEEFISGKPSAIHSLSGFRGEKIYVFPPARFTQEEKEKLIALAKTIHEHVGVEHYLKTDFILSPKGKIYVTELSFSPDLRDKSHFGETYSSVGAKAEHIIEHILNRA